MVGFLVGWLLGLLDSHY